MKITLELDLHSRDIERLGWAIAAMREEYREREKTALNPSLRADATSTISRLDVIANRLTSAWRQALTSQAVTLRDALQPEPKPATITEIQEGVQRTLALKNEP